MSFAFFISCDVKTTITPSQPEKPFAKFLLIFLFYFYCSQVEFNALWTLEFFSWYSFVKTTSSSITGMTTLWWHCKHLSLGNFSTVFEIYQRPNKAFRSKRNKTQRNNKHCLKARKTKFLTNHNKDHCDMVQWCKPFCIYLLPSSVRWKFFSSTFALVLRKFSNYIWTTKNCPWWSENLAKGWQSKVTNASSRTVSVLAITIFLNINFW